MNITKQIAKLIGGEIEKLILDNEEIQFYQGVDKNYHWQDKRFEDTKLLSTNPVFKTKLALIRHFKKHLKSKNPNIQYKRNIPPELKSKMDDYLNYLKKEKHENNSKNND